MTDNVPTVPALGEALRGWLAARKETEAHLTDNKGAPLTKEWIQKLSDLLTTEHAWQEQYTDLLRVGGVGKFPESRR
jgi:hypothetical protein